MDAFEKYAGQWVLIMDIDDLVNNNIIFSNKDYLEVYKESKKLGIKSPFIYFVPTYNLPFAGF